MLKSTVPTPAKTFVCTGGVAAAPIANTSSSGREKRTAGLQLRPRPSSHRLVLGLSLTMSPVSGRAVPSKFVLGAGRPPGAVKNPPGGVSDGTWWGARSLVAHRTFGERGRAVAGMEDRRIDRVPIRADRERAWRVAEQRHDRQQRAVRTEHPHVGPADARRLRVREYPTVLATARGRDEGPAAAREDDVARLIAHLERPRHARRARADVDGADACRGGV